jgi:hypothetical protein
VGDSFAVIRDSSRNIVMVATQKLLVMNALLSEASAVLASQLARPSPSEFGYQQSLASSLFSSWNFSNNIVYDISLG